MNGVFRSRLSSHIARPTNRSQMSTCGHSSATKSRTWNKWTMPSSWFFAGSKTSANIAIGSVPPGAVAAVTTAKGKGKEKPADEGDVVAHDGEALHRQARHRQQAERAATMVEQTLLEHGVYDYVDGTGVPSPGPTPR